MVASVADIVRPQLEPVRASIVGMDNAVEQDDHIDSWGEALWAVGTLLESAERLQDEIRSQYNKREEE